jgi:pyrroline-5-carboxylate reductase
LNLNEIGPVVLVGAGKMGLALARGWVAGGLPADQLVLIEPQPSEAATAFVAETKCRLQSGPGGVLTHVLVLAVKPQVMAGVLAELRPTIGPHTLVLSIAAGISIAAIGDALGTERVIRTMPNTPAQIGKGVTGAVPGAGLLADDAEAAEALLGAAGKVVWFTEEAMLDAVTAVSGSGPAYVFNLVESLAAAGERQGLAPEDAMLLARETVIGAAALMAADPAPASVLRENVTSPKGTTAAALEVLQGDDGLDALMDRAVTAARLRSEELGR